MTDAEKVALCRAVIREFWEYGDDKSAEAMDTVINAVSTVLDFAGDGKDG